MRLFWGQIAVKGSQTGPRQVEAWSERTQPSAEALTPRQVPKAFGTNHFNPSSHPGDPTGESVDVGRPEGPTEKDGSSDWSGGAGSTM